VARQNKIPLDAIVATLTDSAWIGVGHLSQLSVHVFGIVSTDIVQIEGSNEDTPTNGIKIGADVTADELRGIDPIPDKLRVRITAVAGGGTITAIVAGNVAP